MKPDNQSECWAVWPQGPHTLLSSVNGQLNIVLACPRTLYSHINTRTVRDEAGEGSPCKPTDKQIDGADARKV